jgi:hypothetical protein
VENIHGSGRPEEEGQKEVQPPAFVAILVSPVVTRPLRLFSPLLSTPAPSARFRVLTVGRGWHRRPRIRSVDPFEFLLVALPGLDSYTLLRRINY